MWGLSIPFWDAVFRWATICAAIFGGIGVTAAFVSAWVGYELADVTQQEADRKIAEARARSDEANGRAEEAAVTAANATKEAATIRERAALTEERLLNERRLTANERWRLERIERTVLPRSLYVNWPALATELKGGNFHPINVALIGKSMESHQFASALMGALQQAGVFGKYIDLSAMPGARAPGSSSGVSVTGGKDTDADRLAEMLWQKFKIGGALFGALPIGWEAIPPDVACLVVGENNAAMSGGNGKPGEGLDEHGEPVPAPQ